MNHFFRKKIIGRVLWTALFFVACSLDNNESVEKDYKIAFAYITDSFRSEIFTVNPDGSNLTRLTENDIYDFGAAWSPDGKKIVYSQNGIIFLMNGDGSNPVQLTENDYQCRWFPKFSADGSKIAFLFGCYGSIFSVMNSDGSSPLNLTEDYSGVNEYYSWSPNALQILYANWVYGDDSLGIQLINADGNGSLTILILENQNGQIPDPVWSPDGKRIAYVADKSINIVNANGNNLYSIPFNQFDKDTNGNPFMQWAPDGSKISFVSERSILQTVRIDGSDHKIIASDLINPERPTWSADGKYIMFVSDDGIEIIDNNGNNRRRIIDSGASGAVWSPRKLDVE